MAAADFYDTLLNRLFADPVLLGRYPDGLGDLMPGDVEADLRIIAEPVDWYGVNYYAPTRVGAPRARRSTSAVSGCRPNFPSPYGRSRGTR